MTHRLAIYLEHLFSNYNVDCEYNREGKDGNQKKLAYQESGCLNYVNKEVYPDIIVHARGEKVNVLVIEAKKFGGDQSEDYAKLRAFTESEKYKYTLGIGFCFEKKLNDTIQSIKLFPEENDKIKQLEECLKFMIFGNKKCTQRRLHVQK